MIKKWNKFNESNESLNEGDIDDILSQGINITLPLSDILKGNTIFIKASSGKIYEYSDGQLNLTWNSDDELKEQTGASLNNEYPVSDSLLRLIEESVDDYRVGHIESIYFGDSRLDPEGNPTDMLKKLLERYD